MPQMSAWEYLQHISYLYDGPIPPHIRAGAQTRLAKENELIHFIQHFCAEHTLSNSLKDFPASDLAEALIKDCWIDPLGEKPCG